MSKSGSNLLHFTASDYYSTPMFASRNPFFTSGGGAVVHLPGATMGGPLRVPHLYNGKDRTFFFFRTNE